MGLLSTTDNSQSFPEFISDIFKLIFLSFVAKTGEVGQETVRASAHISKSEFPQAPHLHRAIRQECTPILVALQRINE